MNQGSLAYQSIVLSAIPWSLIEVVGHFSSIYYFNLLKKSADIEKNYRFSNTFWLYQHRVKYAQFLCYSHLKLQNFKRNTLYRPGQPNWKFWFGSLVLCFTCNQFSAMKTCKKLFALQGVSFEILLFQMAVIQKLCIFDPMLLKPKCVWEAVVLFIISCFLLCSV